MIIRKESEADYEAITEVTKSAFEPLEMSEHTEQFIIKALRNAHALTISLVAEINGRIVGHIAFSPITISDGSTDWYGLGPISVMPEFQKQGIGGALIHEGFKFLKELKAKGCALVGHPDYYKRFGFMNTSSLYYEGIPQEYFLVIYFEKNNASGKVQFHPGFDVKE